MPSRHHNAAIYLLSSRREQLEACLALFFKNWNCRFNYPVYVYHFEDIYPDYFVEKIQRTISRSIYFTQIEFEIPSHIDEPELFYNRRHLEYVRKSFPPSRIGYLHMEHFASHITFFGQKGCPGEELAQYDYLMRIDDDSWFKKNIDFDLFDAAANFPISTAYTWRHTNWRNEQTTEGLWPFYRRYLAKEGIKSSDIKNSVLRQALLNQGDMETFPKSLEISCGNCNIYNVSAFKDPQFKKWIDAVDRYGGHYKHRWGDIEVLALYTATMYAHPIHDFNLVGRGLYRPQLPGTKLAPSISIWKLGVIRMLRNILRVFTYYPLRYLHNQLRPLFYRAVHRVRTVVSRLFVGNQGR